MRILLTTVLCVLLLACSSSDPKPTPTPTLSQAPATATPAPAPTQTPVVVVVTATPGSAPAAPPVSAPQQSQPSVPPVAACTPASQIEISAIAALIVARTAVAPTPAEQAVIRQALALVDRNGDGMVDANVCREAITQATQLLR